MEPSEVFGDHCRRSGDYACEEDLMSSLFLLCDSPPPSPLWPLSLPPAEGFAGPENFGDGGQISPLDEVPCLAFGDGQISPLDELPCIPAAAEETNYAAARAAPLVATHGTGPGQFSSNFSLSSTTSHECDEEEVQQTMRSLLPPPKAPDGLLNTTNGGLAARSHADAVPPLVQRDTTTRVFNFDELPHPQQQLPQPTNDSGPEVQPGGGWVRQDCSLADESHIQRMTPTILPSQPPSPTPMINPGPDDPNRAASAPMGSQGTLIPAAPQDQEANILSRTSARRRPIKSRGHPSRLQDGPDKLFVTGIDMISQFGRYIGQMLKEEEKDRSIVRQHFRGSRCKLYTICQYCNTLMMDPTTTEMLRHLESRYNNIHLLPAASRASKESQQSSQAVQIKEIAENPSGESEPIERDNSNCATAARVDTPGTNAVVLSPRQQHQLMVDREEQIATILTQSRWSLDLVYDNAHYYISVPDLMWDLIIRLSDSSYCSSTTKSTHDGFRLKFYNKKEEGSKVVHVHVSETNPYVDQSNAGVFLETTSRIWGRPYLSLTPVEVYESGWESAPAWCTDPWRCMYLVLHSLGFRKEFATSLVAYAFGRVDDCNLWLSRPRSTDRGKSVIIVEEQGDVSSGKRRRKPALPRSKVWNHFMKLEVEAEGGSMITKAKCNYCSSELKAGSASHGTTQLKRHIRSRHPEHAESL